MIGGIVFDWDGTLAYRAKRLSPYGICRLLRENGCDVYSQEWEGAYRFAFYVEYPKGGIATREDFVRRVLELLDAERTDEIVSKAARYWAENEEFRFYPDAESVRGLDVEKAILTTIPGFRFNRMDISCFNPVMTGREIGRAKPHPDGFLKILKKWGMGPEEALMVGNEVELDLLPAKELGIGTVLIDRERKEDGKEADYVISSLKEIPKILESLR